MFSLLRTRVRLLVRELRSHRLHSEAKKKINQARSLAEQALGLSSAQSIRTPQYPQEAAPTSPGGPSCPQAPVPPRAAPGLP